MDDHLYLRRLRYAADMLDAHDQVNSLASLLACMEIDPTAHRALGIFVSGEPHRYHRAARFIRDEVGCVLAYLRHGPWDRHGLEHQ